jgi:hypothetical protein
MSRVSRCWSFGASQCRSLYSILQTEYYHDPNALPYVLLFHSSLFPLLLLWLLRYLYLRDPSPLVLLGNDNLTGLTAIDFFGGLGCGQQVQQAHSRLAYAY